MDQSYQVIGRRLYPLCFEPICQYTLWGGRRLGALNKAFTSDDLIGEVWLLSDRDDFSNRVKNGAFRGATLGEILSSRQEELMGKFKNCYQRFPLLLKFLDACEMLSVQVHPTCSKREYLKKDERSKTEGWIALEAGPESSIYAGVKVGVTEGDLRKALKENRLTDYLRKFQGKPGDAFFLPAGTIHSLGDTVVFEVQQNSDTTYRLYDWNRVDAKTGLRRELQIEAALACTDLEQLNGSGPQMPIVEASAPVLRERIFDCKHFKLWRHSGSISFTVGEVEEPRVLVAIKGGGYINDAAKKYGIEKGEVMLLPALTGKCVFEPQGESIILEIALPESAFGYSGRNTCQTKR